MDPVGPIRCIFGMSRDSKSIGKNSRHPQLGPPSVVPLAPSLQPHELAPEWLAT